jgi:hypothetical protein
MSSPLGMGVNVADAKAILVALRQFEPDLRKQTQKKIRRAGVIIAKDARRRIPKQPPMTGWRTVPAKKGRTRGGAGWPAWVSPTARISVKTAQNTRTRAGRRWDLIKIVNRNAVGSIYEFAANGQSSTGDQFVRNLDRYGRPGRAIWTAVDANMDAVEADVRLALEVAEQALRRRT